MQFEKALQALCEKNVDFVVIGGLSAAFHGSAQMTCDLDICYARTSVNLSLLTAALKPWHPRLRGIQTDLPFVCDEATLRNAPILTLPTDLGAIDLLAEVAGLGSFDEVKKHSVIVDAFGKKIATLSLPALIRAKRAAGREKDFSSLAELESLLEADNSADDS